MKESITIKDVFAISDIERDQKGRWTKVGVGFVNRDNSLNIILDAYPVSGRLHVRDRETKKREQT